MSDAAIGLGSNVGDRRAALQAAYDRLAATPGLEIVDTSFIYESEPWGYRDQPAFLNAVVRVATTLGPLQLFIALQTAERAVGRSRTFRWGPREIDLDLLVYDAQSVNRRGLTVPHPRLLERAFVLVPLAEAWPEAPLPGGVLMCAALAAVEAERQSLRVVDHFTTPANTG